MFPSEATRRVAAAAARRRRRPPPPCPLKPSLYALCDFGWLIGTGSQLWDGPGPYLERCVGTIYASSGHSPKVFCTFLHITPFSSPFPLFPFSQILDAFMAGGKVAFKSHQGQNRDFETEYDSTSFTRERAPTKLQFRPATMFLDAAANVDADEGACVRACIGGRGVGVVCVVPGGAARNSVMSSGVWCGMPALRSLERGLGEASTQSGDTSTAALRRSQLQPHLPALSCTRASCSMFETLRLSTTSPST